MIFEELRRWLQEALAPWAREKGLAGLPDFSLEEPPPGIEGDVATNLALLLARPLKQAPRKIAAELEERLKSAGGSLVREISIAGAGFVNFRWALPRLHDEVRQVTTEGPAYGRGAGGSPRKILIEFVSANPTGPLHVGHGRGAALGDSLALILSHLGHAVTREYYINDAGNQVEMLGRSLVARAREALGKPFEMPEDGYHGDYLKEAARRFVQAHPGRAEDADAAVRFALEELLGQIRRDLDDFGVRFDSWFSEASLVKGGHVERHLEQLRRRGHVEDSEGAVWFVAPDEEEQETDKNRVLRRRDGRWTYFATDIAYHADKLVRGFDRLIDVWGADHHGYVPRVKGSLQALGYDPGRLHIVLYQLVSLTRSGVPVSMSKRSGDFVTLREVLEEVGRDACRFFFALRGPNTALDFDLELAKQHTADNPVYYLQYAHARICSIFRQAAERGATPDPEADLSPLKEKEERDLMKRLALFPQTLVVCAQEDSPHPLANYLLSLARQFHYFYDHHRVLGEARELTQARLRLLQAVRQVLKLGAHLLGVSAPESM